MERIGKRFEFGAPHFYRGAEYGWPDESRDYPALLKARKEELAPVLLERLRSYIKEFGVRTHSCYPHFQMGETGLVLHLGDGGRWIDIYKHVGTDFLSEHNLDAYADNAAAFNVGSDVLELLDDSILAPRIHSEQGIYVMRYPLPQGMKTIVNPLFSQEGINSLSELMGWKETRLITEEGLQRVEHEEGTITVKEGMCEGRGFEMWDIPKASWIMSRLMSLC